MDSPIGFTVTPSAGDQIEAEREVEYLTGEAATIWRAAGALPGQRSRYVDELLNERLVDALAKLRALEGGENWETMRDAVSEQCGEIAKLDEKRSLGGDFEDEIRKASDCKPHEFPERAAELIDALAERVDELRSEVAELKAERSETPAAPPSNVRVLRPGVRKGKPRTGHSTLSLFPTEEPVVREVVPAKIGKVDGVAKAEPAKRRGRKKAVGK